MRSQEEYLDMPEPMTVAQLTERLAQFDSNLVVMVDCEDHYYQGPLDAEICTAEAGLTGPYEYLTPAEDAYGRKVPQQKRHYPGGHWLIVDANRGAPLVERRPCLVLRAK